MKKLGFAALPLMIAASALAGDPLFYATTSYGDFGTLDPLTGTFSLIANTGQMRFVGLGFAADGNLYGLDGSLVVEINTNNGNTFTKTPVGYPQVDGKVGESMAGSPSGILYAYGSMASTLLYTVQENSTATVIGGMGYNFGGGFAADGAGNLYITAGRGTEQLFKVNPQTGAATLIGDTGTLDSFAMTFEGDTLYLAALNGTIWTVNPATGASTIISGYNEAYGAIFALASPDLLNVPEPAMPALAGVGTLGLLLGNFLSRAVKGKQLANGLES